MADDSEGLPHSGDPFELLGVAPDDDERTIKRAYAALVKRFRPDRHPEEFQRVQAAFETVQAWRREGVRFETPPPLDAAPPRDERPSDRPREAPPDETPNPWFEALDLCAEGRTDIALQRLRALADADPQDAFSWQAGFLVAELAGKDTSDALRWLSEGLEHGAPVASFIALAFDEEEFDGEARIAHQEAFERLASVLRLERVEQADPHEAHAIGSLLDRRLMTELRESTESEVIDVLRAPEVVRVARRTPSLRHVGMRAACALALEDEARAEELFQLYAIEPFESNTWEERFLVLRTLREEWQAFLDAAEPTPVLRRAVALCSALPPAELRRLDLPAALAAAPDAHLHALDVLLYGDAQLGAFLLEAASSSSLPKPDPNAGYDADGEAYAREGTRALDELVEPGQNKWIAGGFVALTIFTARHAGWWLLVPMVAGMAWLIRYVHGAGSRDYLRGVRPHAARWLVEKRVPVDDLVAAIGVNLRSTDELSRFDRYLARDLSLQALAQLLHFGPRR